MFICQTKIDLLHQEMRANEVGTDTRRLVESFRRWKRRRAYHKQLQRRNRAKSRNSSSPANDLRLGKY